MIIVPHTPITDASFDKWRSHRIDVEDDEDKFYYYIIPFVDVDESELERIETIPALFSSESDGVLDSVTGQPAFTMRLFDDDLPEITSEEEVEILYKILTKRDLLRR
ncbi:hypothetical protein UFOVP449_51 [uncultured Caudovirales phage]|uniref:Uncharacterized protein n=1 Tax=uncultured Caudovirales phage TaxID=2100421 RepID=A0A6J5M649_9CAUD|nr:hypothetical protein UFOVP449_51 [uncultured Caudovirales phage]